MESMTVGSLENLFDSERIDIFVKYAQFKNNMYFITQMFVADKINTHYVIRGEEVIYIGNVKGCHNLFVENIF